jgi:hypothetical protein
MAVWYLTIRLADVWNEPGLLFTETRDEIVRRIRASGWENPELSVLLDEIEEAPDISTFDYLWNTLYDLADHDRVWIATF